MKCKIVLNNGKAGVFTARGELNFGVAGFSIFYELDGDKCLLTYTNGTLVQERKGGVPMKMVFTQGKKTECFLGDDNMGGSFEVFTNKIEIKNTSKSVDVKLIYTCAGENITLTISAS